MVDAAKGSESDGLGAAMRPELRVQTTRLERALDWAQALAPSSFRVTSSCCGMSMVSGGDPFEALGAGPPAVSARAADLLLVAGPITRPMAPLLESLYERMLEPRWVVAWGACSASGGAYRNYATVHGLHRLIPVDVVVPGCPPSVTAFRAVLEYLRSGQARRRDGSLLESRHPVEWPILREAPSGELMNHPTLTGLEIGPRRDPEENQDVDPG